MTMILHKRKKKSKETKHEVDRRNIGRCRRKRVDVAGKQFNYFIFFFRWSEKSFILLMTDGKFNFTVTWQQQQLNEKGGDDIWTVECGYNSKTWMKEKKRRKKWEYGSVRSQKRKKADIFSVNTRQGSLDVTLNHIRKQLACLMFIHIRILF